MPRIARNALIRQLERSGMLDELAADTRVLFKKRLRFVGDSGQAPEDSVCVPLQVGAITLGVLTLPASGRPERNRAYRNWLGMAAREFARRLHSPDAQPSAALPEKIRRALSVIRQRSAEPLSLGEVAEETGLSRERLSRLFREAMGITFSDYLTQVRLNHARQSLRSTDLPVTRIAFASGFQSISQFNRRFRSSEGVSPGAYRKRFARTGAADAAG